MWFKYSTEHCYVIDYSTDSIKQELEWKITHIFQIFKQNFCQYTYLILTDKVQTDGL